MYTYRQNTNNAAGLTLTSRSIGITFWDGGEGGSDIERESCEWKVFVWQFYVTLSPIKKFCIVYYFLQKLNLKHNNLRLKMPTSFLLAEIKKSPLLLKQKTMLLQLVLICLCFSSNSCSKDKDLLSEYFYTFNILNFHLLRVNLLFNI